MIDRLHDSIAPKSKRKARIIHDEALTAPYILAERKELIMEKYKLVSQENEWGCGAACVASLLGISYVEAKKRVERVKGAPIDEGQDKLGLRPGLELHHIVITLRNARVKVIADWYPDLNTIPVGTIACIGNKTNYKDEHYILMTPEGWMDPWYNLDIDNMSAGYRKSFPRGTKLLVALIPVKMLA